MARLHRSAYSRDHFLALLPEAVLTDYYARYLGDGSQIVLAVPPPTSGAVRPGDALLGFAVFGRGIEPRIAAFKRDHRINILLAGLGHPMVAAQKVLGSLGTLSTDGPAHVAAPSLLLSIAVGEARKGVGLALLEEILRRAALAGEHRMGLYVRHKNVAAIRAYLRVGFRIVESIGDQYYMERELIPVAREGISASDSARDFLAFAAPDIGEEEIAEVVDTLRSGWVTTGPKARRFEEQFAEYLGGGVEAIAVNSATSGLHLALEALGVGPGDEVITTTHTFTATAEVIRYLGATPVFVDVKPDSLCIDVEAVRAAVTPRTKVLLPVHFAGLAADMTTLLAIAREHGLRVVEDAAHALPTTHRGEMIGTLASDMTVFSFYANKTITTGEGGMLVTRDQGLATRARTMRLHGIDRDAFGRFTAKAPSWYYEVVAPGFKYNLTDIAASIGMHQLRRVEQLQSRREEIALAYDDAFRELPLVLPKHADPGDRHAWHLYVIRLEDAAGVGRDRFIERMHSFGVGCSVHYIPLHLQPYWRDEYHLTASMFPSSQHAYERIVSLPIYSRMSSADVERVTDAVVRSLS